MSFDNLPNEIYLLIFDYLNPIEIIYSFSNLNKRINDLFVIYSKLSIESIDLTRLNPFIFKEFLLKPNNCSQFRSIKLTDKQFQSIEFNLTNRIVKLIISLEDPFHLYSHQLSLFENLKEFQIENNYLTWSKPFVICNYFKKIQIHLKEHNDLIDLLNNLPVIELINVTIDYDVTSCRETSQLILSNLSNKLIDFRYEILSKHGLIYFVTDYSSIEYLVNKLIHLKSLHLYIIGCLNTIIDKNRLQNNFLTNLTKLEKFNYFLQSYGGKPIKSMEEYYCFKYKFGCYSNVIEDMFYYFTLPFQFARLDQCVQSDFIQSIQTNFPKCKNELGLNCIKHIDLSCSITLKLLIVLQKSFQCLKSIRLFSLRSDHETFPLFFQQSKFEIKSVETIIFDFNCQCQPTFIRFFPNLTKLIICQSLLNILLDQFDYFHFEKIRYLIVYCFQRHYLSNILSCFINLISIKLRTISNDDESPIRSFVEGRCLHKHRPISLVDTLIQLFQSQLNRLKSIEIGCFFERDQINIETIISNYIQKYKFNQKHYFISVEPFHSTRCGTTKILFF